MCVQREMRFVVQVVLSSLLFLQTYDSIARNTKVDVAKAVRIVRTSDGIPHIRAGDWRGIGMGMGYVQAQDALCTLADTFVTFEGKRSYFFGVDAKPSYKATFTGANNLELDIFFRAFLDRETITRLKSRQPSELLDLLDGYARGYNSYLVKARSNQVSETRCAHAEWVRPITSDDLLRRIHAAGLAAGYARFIPEIVNARPPNTKVIGNHSSTQPPPYSSWSIGEHAGLGSNALAFGADASNAGAVLFGNPHWYWGGPDRFYQAHITIPGKLDVAGVAFLGIPLIMVGFNRDVAWTHTVSSARRFGLYALQLVANDPLTYQIDGSPEIMDSVDISVPIRGKTKTDTTITRRLYRTRFGPVIDFGTKMPEFGWTAKTVLAIRDVNASNDRLLWNYMELNRATSLKEFVDIQTRELAMPWVNTIAIGRDDPRVWYGDIGAVPGVSDALKEACGTSLANIFSRLDPKVPFLDGTRADCMWRTDISTVQPATLPAHQLPSLFRRDYVANMNDSYWLTNPAAPLEGYASLLGGEREPLSLRGRHGHDIAHHIIANAGNNPEQFIKDIKVEVLSARNYTFTQFKYALLAGACAQSEVQVSRDALTDIIHDPPRTVNVSHACNVLKNWRGTAGLNDHGALLWDAFWSRVRRIPTKDLYAWPFDPLRPLETPAMPRSVDPRIADAMAQAVLDFSRQGRALDSTVGQYLYVNSGGTRVPLYGGCGDGYFTIACPADGQIFNKMDKRAHANSYVQIVRFVREGVEAYTLLAHGQLDSAVEGGAGENAIRRYAAQRWLKMPFAEQEILRDLHSVEYLLQP